MDKSQIVIATQKELDDMDDDYWKNSTIEERLETIVYLRECFYGKKATTGRVQRFHKMLKLK
jgi:hypothetical protein